MAEVTNYDEAAQVARVYGFHFHETCQCGGTLQHKWRKSKMELKIYPRKKRFRLISINSGQTIIGGEFEQLEKLLDENAK